jgi:hypothetical protein
MAIYVEVGARCWEEARRHGLSERIDDLREKIESSQTLATFEPLRPSALLKRKLARNFRLIALARPFGDDTLVVLARVLTRGGDEYGELLEHVRHGRAEEWLDGCDDLDPRSLYEGRVAAAPRPRYPSPDEEDNRWLYGMSSRESAADDLIVLESGEWVAWMGAGENVPRRGQIQRALSRLDLDQLHVASAPGDCRLFEDEALGVWFVYCHLRAARRLLLLEPLRDEGSGANRLEYWQGKLNGVAVDDLGRVAARSYPYFMVLEADCWLAIQGDSEANLALSPEEAELLDGIRHGRADVKFPLFINGRAGSGKSTMLQYLAADAIELAVREGARDWPIYLTSSGELLARARETVEKLLLRHHSRLLEGPLSKETVGKALDRCFADLDGHFRDLLPAQSAALFPPERKIGYSQFRRFWEQDYVPRFHPRDLEPDLAWHTIRSFIKGSECDGEHLTPEGFEDLARKRRSVSAAKYARVYKDVWEAWYRPLCEQEGWWDDQDLAARVLAEGVGASRYAAVFCDEAQDFTPLQLAVLFQLSVFCRRTLAPEELARVPIVFAGDPLQTINPTGFRWENVQSDFRDRFQLVLDPNRRSNADFTYRELHFNYRSNPGIVKFCNLIQLVRSVLLDAPEIQPQQAWWSRDAVPAVWFELGDGRARSQIERRAELVKIVDCEQGDESSFCELDETLKRLPADDGVVRNVLGPTRAKGLEFPVVVLYRFAERAPLDFASRLAQAIQAGPLEDPEERLPYEYFLNRLYVAASRGREQLIVVDDFSGAARDLWDWALDPSTVDRLVKAARYPEAWESRVATLVRGSAGAWDGEPEDPVQQARGYEAIGKENRDSFMLRQAAANYRSGRDAFSADSCLALAAEIEGRHGDAAEYYRGINLKDDAFRCLWTAREWSRAAELARETPSLAGLLEGRAATFMAGRPAPAKRRGSSAVAVAPDRDAVERLAEALLGACREPGWLDRRARDPVWNQVFVELVGILGTGPSGAAPPCDVHELTELLAGAGVDLPRSPRAEIAFRAESWSQAVALWEEAGSTGHRHFWLARARSSPYPRSLPWFSQAGAHEEVLAQWRQHEQLDRMDEADVDALLKATIAQRETALALVVVNSRGTPQRLASLMRAAIEEGSPVVAVEAACASLRYLIHAGRWRAAATVLEHQGFVALADLALAEATAFSRLLNKARASEPLLATAVEQLAGSERFGEEASGRARPVAELLERLLVGDKGATTVPAVDPRASLEALLRARRTQAATRLYRRWAEEGLLDEEKLAELASLIPAPTSKAGRPSKPTRLGAREEVPSEPRPDETAAVAVARPQEDSAEVLLPPFRLVVVQARRELVIRYLDRPGAVVIEGLTGRATGDLPLEDTSGSGADEGQLPSWLVPDWGARVEVLEVGDSPRVMFRSGPYRLELALAGESE